MRPVLPPELWLDIFSLAVHVPRLLDTKWNNSPDELIWEGPWTPMDPDTMETESLELRKIIVQVSREWWIIGRSFLYEDLLVNRPAAVETLATLFEQSVNSTLLEDHDPGSSRDETGYGRWVKRIRIEGDEWFKGNAIAFSDLERLLKRCPNVQIIFLTTSIRYPSYFPRISQLFQCMNARSLRRIAFSRLPHEGGLGHIFHPANTPISLDWAVLPSDWILKAFPNTINSQPPASFSNLSILEIVNHVQAIDDFPSWDLPALRYFSVKALNNVEIESFIPFMATNGHRLIGLSLWTTQRCRDLHRFLDYTPVLQCLVFDDLDLDTLQPPGSPSYASITYIGLAGTNYNYSSDTTRIRKGLDYILRYNLFPNLRTVRILADNIPRRFDDEWEQPIAIAAQYGIRLEDRDKDLLRYEPILSQ